MIDIQVEGLIKSFEIGKNVLDGVTFQIDQGERVGLLGRNGAGKSTLFRILTGELEPDEGQAIIASGRRVGLISQIPVYPAGCTVEDVLRSAFARLQKLGEEMESLTERMAAGENDPALLRRYDTLSARFEAFGGYDTDVAVDKVANGLSISHDRYFLDRVVTRVSEIEDGKPNFYSGNYSFYAVEKERRYQERMKQYE